jgi:TolB-like protein
MTHKKTIIFILLLIGAYVLCFGETQVISVLYFENTTDNKEYNWLSKGLADMLITDLASAKDFSVVEREEIEKIVKEQERSLSDLYDEANAVRIGKLLSAKQMVIGSFIIHQKTLRIDAKIVNIETGKLLKAVMSNGELANLFALQKDLAANILKELGASTPMALAGQATESLDAAKAYYTGINFLDQGAFDEAAQSFRQSLQFDPFFQKPQTGLEDSYKFLKDFKKQRYQREINKLFEKAAEIKRRLAGVKWLTYADFLTECYKKGLSREETQKLTDANPTYYTCDSRAQCTWELQNTLSEIADKTVEYFEDTATAVKMHKEILYIADQARVQLKTDPFFPEILYMELFSLEYFEQWDKVKAACEFLMTNYADYRMMWAVEDKYERVLEKLSGKRK